MTWPPENRVFLGSFRSRSPRRLFFSPLGSCVTDRTFLQSNLHAPSGLLDSGAQYRGRGGGKVGSGSGSKSTEYISTEHGVLSVECLEVPGLERSGLVWSSFPRDGRPSMIIIIIIIILSLLLLLFLSVCGGSLSLFLSLSVVFFPLSSSNYYSLQNFPAARHNLFFFVLLCQCQCHAGGRFVLRAISAIWAFLQDQSIIG